MSQDILNYLKKKPEKQYTAQEISDEIGVGVNSVRSRLRRLERWGAVKSTLIKERIDSYDSLRKLKVDKIVRRKYWRLTLTP